MAFKLQPGLILGGNVTLSPTGTPFIKDANWSKAYRIPVGIKISTEMPFSSTSVYDVDGTITTGGTTIGGDAVTTTRWGSTLLVNISTEMPFSATSMYDDGTP